MPFCSEYDLRQAAASYYAEGFRLVGQPVRWTYIERKADQIGAWWCRHHQHHNTARAAAQAQNKKDRWAFMCDKFGGEDRITLGQERGHATQTRRADHKAQQAQRLKRDGWTAQQIAEHMGVVIRTVWRWLRRRLAQDLSVVVQHLKSGKKSVTSGKGSPAGSENNSSTGNTEQPLPDVTLPAETPHDPDSIDVLAELRRHWDALETPEGGA